MGHQRSFHPKSFATNTNKVHLGIMRYFVHTNDSEAEASQRLPFPVSVVSFSTSG